MRQGKPYQFKAPPKLNGIYPLLLSYSIEIRTSGLQDNNAAKKLHIDISHVEEADALGVAIFCANLAKSIGKHQEFEFQIKYPTKEEPTAILRASGIETLFAQLGLTPTQSYDLWHPESTIVDRQQPSFSIFDEGRQAILFTPDSQRDSGRSSLIFAREHLKRFYAKNPASSINYKQLHHILDEIIKNAIDHSTDAAVTALKFSTINGAAKLHFAHCELGDGIHANVSAFLKQCSDPTLQRIGNSQSISECLHWAFTPGNTSKPNSGLNAGLGLPHMRSASRGGDIEVYFKDARSIAYVADFPEIYSHKQIRRRLYHTYPIPCFMYFGETK